MGGVGCGAAGEGDVRDLSVLSPDSRIKNNYKYPSETRMVVGMDQHAFGAVEASYRNGGRAAIISGLIGFAAFGLLMDAVLTRVSWIPSDRLYLLFDAHDIGVALQFLLLISVVLGLRTLSRQSQPGLNKATFAMGVGAIVFVVLFVLLGIHSKIVSNGWYTFPQGIFGIWLIVVNWRLSGSLPGWLRWLGMIVGLGLALVGICFVGLCFVYPSILAIPAIPPESMKEVNSAANTFFHQLLFYASFMGVAPLPIWTFLTGFQLLKKRR
jgi:hypothetical protein